MIEALATALLLGALNALLDFVTAELKLETRPIYILARVVLVCSVVGTIIGARGRQLMIGAVSGIAIGVLLGGAYHMLLTPLGFGALALTWLVFWVFFGLLEVLLQEGRGVALAIALSIGAAALSALVYYALSRVWQPVADQPSYLRVLAIWTS